MDFFPLNTVDYVDFSSPPAIVRSVTKESVEADRSTGGPDETSLEGKQTTQNEEEEHWFVRIQADAEEYLRLLYDDRTYHLSLNKLENFSFNDLPNPVSFAADLLNIIRTKGRGAGILRKCIYAVLRKHILDLRPHNVNSLIESIRKAASQCHDIDTIVELDLCVAILCLITNDESLLESIRKVLNNDIRKKTPNKMIHIILQVYQGLNVHWRLRWFPLVIEMEELANKVMTKQEGLIEFKKHIYQNHQDDWRIMCIALKRLEQIIQESPSEDIRDSAYWIGMLGGKSIKLAQFADPQDILLPSMKYGPLLEWQARYCAVRLLVSLTKNKDPDIAADARKHLWMYRALEQDPKILLLHEKINLTSTSPSDSGKVEERQHCSSSTAEANQAKPTYSLDPSDYGEDIKSWMAQYGIKQVLVEKAFYNQDGQREFWFSILPTVGNSLPVCAWRKNKVTVFRFRGGAPDHLEKYIRSKNTPSMTNAYLRMYESMCRTLYDDDITTKDAALVTDFFETLLIGDSPCFESIVLSCIHFLTMFGFTFSNNKWGIITLEELNNIANMKLCLSYLHMTRSNAHATEAYLHQSRTDLVKNRLALITFIPMVTKSKEGIHYIINLFNRLQQPSASFSFSKVLCCYSDVIDILDSIENPRHVLYECTLSMQKVLLGHANSCTFSVNKASIYLHAIERFLAKSEIGKIRYFINLILRNTKINLGNNRIDKSLQLIQAFNVIAPYIYFDKKSIAFKEWDIFYRSIDAVWKIAEFLSESGYDIKPNLLTANVCALYSFSYYWEKKWPKFKQILRKAVGCVDIEDFRLTTSTLNSLISNSIRFFTMNGKHSEVLNEATSTILDRILAYSGQHRKTLLYQIANNVYPLSFITWESGLRIRFLRLIEDILACGQMNYNRLDIDSVLYTIHSIQKFKDNIYTMRRSDHVSIIYNKINQSYQSAIDDLIRLYIVPAWKKQQNENTDHALHIILSNLSLDVKEDSFFLRRLEENYQDFLLGDASHHATLDAILSDIAERFKHPPQYSRIKPEIITTYTSCGKVHEKRREFNMLPLILGEHIELSSLKLGDVKHSFLNGLITPICINNARKITGFGGGGKMKMKLTRHGVPDTAILPLVNIEDITHGRFGRFLEAIPFAEGYYYWQRMFNPRSSDGDVITGTFNVLFVEDATVKFKNVTNADGCGFLKSSILGSLANQLKIRSPYSTRKPMQTYQAVQHYKKCFYPQLFDAAVVESVESILERVDQYLAASPYDQSSVKELFSLITTGSIADGRNFVAIPACGTNSIILPISLKNSDIIIGKSPYESSVNVLPRKEDDVSHTKSADEKKRMDAKYVANLTGFQYSFLGTHSDSISFTKGIIIVIPDEEWPHKDVDLIFCTKDKKVDSRWKTSKSYPPHGSVVTYNGVLTAIQKYGPGSFMAVSPDIQINTWSADYDGDIVTVEKKPKDSKMFDLILETTKHYTPYRTPKIPKTFTPARRQDGLFSVFRFYQIMQSRVANLLTAYSRYYDIFMALRTNFQQRISYTIANIENIEHIIKNILIDESEQNIKDSLVSDPSHVIRRVLSSGVKTGSDAFKSTVDWRYFKEFGRIMEDTLRGLSVPSELEYFKKLSITMHTNKIDFIDTMLESKFQMIFCDSFPLHILHKTLSRLPQYKKKRLSQLLATQVEIYRNNNQDVLKHFHRKTKSQKTHFRILNKEKREMLQKLAESEVGNRRTPDEILSSEVVTLDPIENRGSESEGREDWILREYEDLLFAPEEPTPGSNPLEVPYLNSRVRTNPPSLDLLNIVTRHPEKDFPLYKPPKNVAAPTVTTPSTAEPAIKAGEKMRVPTPIDSLASYINFLIDSRGKQIKQQRSFGSLARLLGSLR